MKGNIGDRIVIESEGVLVPPRVGVIEEVLDPEEPRYRVRWENGNTSIIVPEAGAAVIQPVSHEHV